MAERGSGAVLNGQPLPHVSEESVLIRALLATGFNYDMAKRPENLRMWDAFTYKARGVRRDGSAALDLCYVAAGRLDGYWERGVSAWDTAAGSLLVEEAGGIATSYANQQYDPFVREVIASNGQLHGQMLDVITPLTNESLAAVAAGEKHGS